MVDAGTVTAAAQQIRLAQPALSRQLLSFEKELGIELFDRTQGRLHLTSAGRDFVPVARELAAHAARTQAAARSLASGVVHRLVLAAPIATLTELVAPFLSTLSRNDPFVLVREALPTHAYETLHTGADVAISPAPVAGQLAHLRLGGVPLRASVSRQHPWAQRRRHTVTLEELVEQQLILLPPENVSRVELDLAVARAGLSYRSVEECAVARVAQAHAAAGHGVCVVTDYPRFGTHDVVIEDLRDATAAPLHVALHAAWNPDHFAVATIERLTGRLESFLRAQPGSLR